MSGYDRTVLLHKAEQKIQSMSAAELESFLGIVQLHIDEIEPLESYATFDNVEIASYVTAIGEEFIGDLGIVIGFMENPETNTRHLALVVVTVEDGVELHNRYVKYLPANRIRKTKRKQNEH